MEIPYYFIRFQISLKWNHEPSDGHNYTEVKTKFSEFGIPTTKKKTQPQTDST